MFYNRVFGHLNVLFQVFRAIEVFTNRVCEQTNRLSNINRVFYNRVFMHIHLRDKSLSQTFCYIIGYIVVTSGHSSTKNLTLLSGVNLSLFKVQEKCKSASDKNRLQINSQTLVRQVFNRILHSDWSKFSENYSLFRFVEKLI